MFVFGAPLVKWCAFFCKKTEKVLRCAFNTVTFVTLNQTAIEMNTYVKYCPNVFVALCEERHEKGAEIHMTTKYGAGHAAIVFNYLGAKGDKHLYSVVRADGFNHQEWAKRRAERLETAASNAKARSDQYYQASQEGKDFLALAEPVKVGHHSERRHRALIDRNWERMGKSVKEADKASEYAERAAYWQSRANDINLSIPESIEFYQFKLHEAIERHQGLKSGEIQREHSFSLTYAAKEVKELKEKVQIAQKLWAD